MKYEWITEQTRKYSTVRVCEEERMGDQMESALELQLLKDMELWKTTREQIPVVAFSICFGSDWIHIDYPLFDPHFYAKETKNYGLRKSETGDIKSK